MASVRSVFQQSTGGATQTVANPAGAADGDLFLMFCALRDLIDGDPNRVGFPSGWTRLVNAWDGFTNSQILWHRYAAADPNPITLSVVGGSALSVALYALTAAGLPVVSALASGGGLNPDSPAVVIPGANGTSVFLSFAGITDGGAGIIISGYPTNYINTANPIGGGSGAGIAARALAAATDNPGPFTQVNSNTWNAWTVGVPDSAGGPGTFAGEPGGGLW